MVSYQDLEANGSADRRRDGVNSMWTDIKSGNQALFGVGAPAEPDRSNLEESLGQVVDKRMTNTFGRGR